MLPKKQRIIILLNNIGTPKGVTASEYRQQWPNLHRQGFHKFAEMTIPLRRLGFGWYKYYRFAMYGTTTPKGH